MIENGFNIGERQGLVAGDRVLLFDGVCKLCNASVRFVIRHDRQRRIKLASMQSPQGQALLKWFGQPTEQFDTVLLIEDRGLSQRSEAFIRLMAQLPAPWCWLRLLRWIPRPLRDWGYDRIAGNRYRTTGGGGTVSRKLTKAIAQPV